ncbi:hypothetical protein ABH945_002876 [Paraburkholderia sp. GAS333]|uniref:DUF2486 family protein n=1 Tax=Paraburkholderia sp. GAS333 TaxID=3156279 RepID=UPI003D1B14B3
MSDPNDNSIPVLHEILVPGQVRSPSGGAVPPALEPDVPREPSFKAEPVLAPRPSHADEPVLATQPVLAEEETLAPEPVIAPQAAHPAVVHNNGAPASSAGVFDRAEPVAPVEAGSIVPPDIAHETAALSQPDLDAEVIAERLRGRFAGFLTGEGRGIIEARCRDALQEHTTLLVSQITREVALTLETELSGWVREAVEEEIARRSGRG